MSRNPDQDKIGAMRILGQGDGWVAIHKPSGFHVHPPESGDFRVPRDRVVLYRLRDQLKQRVYPVHRLDAGTSGVLMMALSSTAASHLGRQFQERRTTKTYMAVVRGWTPSSAVIDLPLELDSSGEKVESRTDYQCQGRIEIPEPVGHRHATARYSLLSLQPHTGRFHQIRRHLNRVSHPIVGDAVHGDSHHNRFFRERLGLPGLCLKAQSLEFSDLTGQSVVIEAAMDEKWRQIESLFAGAWKVETIP